MAFIQTVTYAIQASVKMAEYQYDKHTISMTAVLEEGDSHEKVLENLKLEVKHNIMEITNGFQ